MLRNWKKEEYENLFGEDIIIIGGGASLVSFSFSNLEGLETIGINEAYLLGVDRCKLTFFSDKAWWLDHQEHLAEYHADGGIVLTHNPTVSFEDHPEWLKTFDRQSDGLHYESLGFGGGSGPSCVNLALILGAKRVHLIGFDGGSNEEGRTHWHTPKISTPNPDVYKKFHEGFKKVAQQLPDKFPGSEVILYSDKTTLDMFETKTMEDFEVLCQELQQRR